MYDFSKSLIVIESILKSSVILITITKKRKFETAVKLKLTMRYLIQIESSKKTVSCNSHLSHFLEGKGKHRANY